MTGDAATFLVPQVDELLADAGRAIERGAEVNQNTVRAQAREIVARVAARSFTLDPRSYAKGLPDHAAHATNTAFVTAALALEAEHAQEICVEITAAALLHDVGHLLLPKELSGVPEPLLDEAGRAVFRQHSVLGARGLLAASCPPLWIATALEHHRGVDGKGYPELASNEAPTSLVRLVSLASFVDRKRASIDGRCDEPEQVLATALSLEGKYFEVGLVARFMRALGVFPPGTTVELSSRDPALVVRANAKEPLRPRVIVLSGTNAGRRLDLAEVDTAERRYVSSIVRAIPPPLLLRARAPTSHPPPAPPEAVPRSRRSTMPAAATARRKAAEKARPAPISSPPRGRVSERPLAKRRDPRVEDGAEPPRSESLDAPRRPASVRPAAPAPAPAPRGRLGALGIDSVLEITVNKAHLATLKLEAREGIVLSRIDGFATLAAIAEALKIPSAQLMPIATRLLSRGVVRRR